MKLSSVRNVGLLAALLVSSVAAVGAPVVLGLGVGFIWDSESPRKSLLLLAGIYAITWFVGSTARYLVFPLYGRLEQSLQSRYMANSLSASLKSDSSARHNTETSEVGFAIDSEANGVRDIFSGVYLAVLPAVVGVVSGIVAVWVTSTWYQALVFVLFLMAYLIVSAPLIRRHQITQTEFFGENMRSFGVLNNFLSLWREARVFSVTEFLRMGYQEDRKRVEGAAEATYSATRLLYLAQGLVLALALAVLMGLNVSRSELEIGQLLGSTVAVAGVCVSAISPLQSVGFGISSIAVAVAHMDEAASKIRLDASEDPPDRGSQSSVLLSQTSGGQLVLEGLMPQGSIPLDAGRPIWFFGASGSGKTTALEELLGLRGASEEAGSFGGPRSYLPQESDLLNKTAFENISFGRNIPHEEVDVLLADLGLSEFASTGNRAVSDVAGELGGASGGEARRMCLARALAGASPLIVLDEPTAGLDSSARAKVWSRIVEASKRSVIIVATHDSDAPVVEGDTVARF